jgi:hypothetical protein
MLSFSAFNLPESLRSVAEDAKLDALEEYSESGFALVGEEDAKGWSNWVSSGQTEAILRSGSNTSQTLEEANISDPYVRWSTLESHADRSMRLPSRSTGEVDPYATILFSDIRHLIVPLQSVNAKSVFRLAWLSLLGLHIPGLSESLSANRRENADDRWSYTCLNSSPQIDALFPSGFTKFQPTAESYAGVIIGREKEYASSFGPVKNWGYGVIDPLESIDGTKGGLWTEKDLEGVDVPFIRRIFAQLRLGANDCEWDVLSLAFEAASSTKR